VRIGGWLRLSLPPPLTIQENGGSEPRFDHYRRRSPRSGRCGRRRSAASKISLGGASRDANPDAGEAVSPLTVSAEGLSFLRL